MFETLRMQFTKLENGGPRCLLACSEYPGRAAQSGHCQSRLPLRLLTAEFFTCARRGRHSLWWTRLDGSGTPCDVDAAHGCQCEDLA